MDLPNLRRQAAELAIGGEHREAAQLYARLLERAPFDGEVALRLGEQRRRIGDLSGAMSAFEQAAELFDAEGRAPQAEAARRIVVAFRVTPRRARIGWWRRALRMLTRTR